MAKQDIIIGAVVGVAIAALAPLVVLAAVGNRKPIMRALARGGQLLSDKAQETFAECQEIVEDFVAEMRVPNDATASAAVSGGSVGASPPAGPAAASSQSPAESSPTSTGSNGSTTLT